MLQAVLQSPVGQLLQTLGRDRRTRDVAAQPLQAAAVIRRDTHVGVQVHVGNTGASRRPRNCYVLRIDPVSQTYDPLARPGTRGDALAHRGAVQRREQGLVLTERIDLAGMISVSEATALEQPGQTTGDTGGDTGHLVIVGRWERMEADPLRFIPDVDAVQHQSMKVDIEIERVTETLHEGNRSTFRIGRPQSSTRPTSQRGENDADEQPQDLTRELGVIRKAEAQTERKCEHPLAHGHLRQDPVDKVSGGIRHSPPTA